MFWDVLDWLLKLLESCMGEWKLLVHPWIDNISVHLLEYHCSNPEFLPTKGWPGGKYTVLCDLGAMLFLRQNIFLPLIPWSFSFIRGPWQGFKVRRMVWTIIGTEWMPYFYGWFHLPPDGSIVSSGNAHMCKIGGLLDQRENKAAVLWVFLICRNTVLSLLWS